MSSVSPNPQNKAVLVTGAAKRLGREIALEFARQGWDVAVHYGRSEAEALATVEQIRSLGVGAHAFQADFAKEVDVDALFSAVIRVFPNLQCLVNSASIFEYDRASAPTVLRAEMMHHHMQVNVIAPMLLSQRMYGAQQHQSQREGGRLHADVVPAIIQVLDQKLINPNPDYLSYTLSKSALLASVELLAMDFAPYLRVVGLAPGISLPSGNQSADDFHKAHQLTPLNKSSTPNDIAKAAVFLAGAGAITGTTLYVDGGQHLMSSERDVMFKTNSSSSNY